MNTSTLQLLDALLRDRLRAEDVALVNSYISAIICESIAAEREAVAAEREACARMADEYGVGDQIQDSVSVAEFNTRYGNRKDSTEEISLAAAIRARGQS